MFQINSNRSSLRGCLHENFTVNGPHPWYFFLKSRNVNPYSSKFSSKTVWQHEKTSPFCRNAPATAHLLNNSDSVKELTADSCS